VRYAIRGDGADTPHADNIPPGCGYPRNSDRDHAVALLTARADRYDKIADGAGDKPYPTELSCRLSDDALRAAAHVNGKTARALAQRVAAHPPYPYATVSTFGYGFAAQGKSPLVSFRPSDACPSLASDEMAVFDVNFVRAARAAEAYKAGVGAVVTVSGGAIHSRLVEAFLLDYLLTCRFGVPADAILLDPCADHTHTNMRNTGSLVIAIGGRTAYIVTDDWLQSRYLEEYTTFDFLFGSIDQRALRDFGYLLGSYRRASMGDAAPNGTGGGSGMKAGFWYTPYRFWAEPADGLGGFTCIP